MEDCTARESGPSASRQDAEDTPSPPPRSRGKAKAVSKVLIKPKLPLAESPEGIARPSPPPKPDSSHMSGVRKSERPPPPVKPPVLSKPLMDELATKHVKDGLVKEVGHAKEGVVAAANSSDKETAVTDGQSEDVRTNQNTGPSPPKPRPRPQPRPKPRPRDARIVKAKSMTRPTPPPRRDPRKTSRSQSQTDWDPVPCAVAPAVVPITEIAIATDDNNLSGDCRNIKESDKRLDDVSEDNTKKFDVETKKKNSMKSGSIKSLGKTKDFEGKVETVVIESHFKLEEEVRRVQTIDVYGKADVEPPMQTHDVESHPTLNGTQAPEAEECTDLCVTSKSISTTSIDSGIVNSDEQNSVAETTQIKEPAAIDINEGEDQLKENFPSVSSIYNIPPTSTDENGDKTASVVKGRSHSYENTPAFLTKEKDVDIRKSWAGDMTQKQLEAISCPGATYENVFPRTTEDMKPTFSCLPGMMTSDVFSQSFHYVDSNSVVPGDDFVQGEESEEVTETNLYQDPGEYVRLEYSKDGYVDMFSKDSGSEQEHATNEYIDVSNMRDTPNSEGSWPTTYQVPNSPAVGVSPDSSFFNQDQGVEPMSDGLQKPRRPAPPPPTVQLRDPLKARPWQQRPYSPSKSKVKPEGDGGEPDGFASRRNLVLQLSEVEGTSVGENSEDQSETASSPLTTSSLYASPYNSTSGLNDTLIGSFADSQQVVNSSNVNRQLNKTISCPANDSHSEYRHPRHSLCSEMGCSPFECRNSLIEQDVTYVSMRDVGEEFQKRQSVLALHEVDSIRDSLPPEEEELYLKPVDAITRLPPARPPPPHFSSPDAEENFYEKINSLKRSMTQTIQLNEEELSTDTDTDDDYQTIKTTKYENDNKLYHIANEILTTEQSFVAALKLLAENFGDSFKKMLKKDLRTMPEGSFTQMFINIEQIYALDKKFLQELEARMRNWEQHRRIGDLIKNYGHFLKMYTSYIKGYDKAMLVFQDNLVRFPKFGAFVTEFERSPECKNLRITSYMLKPIQRIPSYRLLLIDYLKHLPRDCSDYRDISGGLQIVSEVAEYINESMKEGEKFQEVLRVQSQIINSKEIVKPGRFLLKEGMLHKLSRKESQERMFFLFTDALLYCSEFGHGQYKLIQELPLAGMTVHVPESVDFVNEFTVVSTKRSFTLAASTPEERLMWLETLNGAIAAAAKKLDSFAIKLDHEDMAPSPVPVHEPGKVCPPWIPDDRVTMCQVCTTAFTVYNRRHHCRACGQVVCSQCSGYEAPLQYMDFEAARVCENCFNELLTKFEQDIRRGYCTWTKTVLSKDDILARFKHDGKKKRPKPGRTLPSKFTEVSAQDHGSSSSGYLRVKRGKTWKKFWFVLKDHVLYSYKASSDPAALETLPVLGYEVKKGSWDADDYIFQLMHQGLKEPLTYKSESKVAAEKWVESLKQATNLDSK